ncbi:hypothetical protein HII36_07290 [Nonomuraea sp. NN258]|uniref:hypothetical protein n=1 Tax=Nonomuraea antri TaxID=2730852 RepID=UPI00156A60B9|nr:hypothetical protein [Nonomuraea antri]NRQ31645.1 hypothetical protein [Nonomuraea antri]
MDVQTFRVPLEPASGAIPLPVALRAVQGIHDLLQYAARTAESGPRLLFTDRRGRDVDAFLRQVGFATAGNDPAEHRGAEISGAETGAAGFGVFLSRVPVAPPGPEPLFGEALTGRRVVTVLHAALRAAREAAERVLAHRDRLGVFDDYVEQGVSANLCAALADVGGGLRLHRPFEVSFHWADSAPAGPPDETVAFTSPVVRVIARAGRELQALAHSGPATITGTVESLWRKGLPPRVKIQGELRTSSGTYERAVWVAVGEADYRRAFLAQIERRALRVDGRLVPGQRRLELRPDGGLEVLPR